MNHHRRVHVVEVAGIDEIDLAAAAFFGGRAEQRDLEIEFIRHCGQTNGGAERRGGDDVVSARVSDLGQGVVLRTKNNVQVAVALGGAKRSGSVGNASFNF